MLKQEITSVRVTKGGSGEHFAQVFTFYGTSGQVSLTHAQLDRLCQALVRLEKPHDNAIGFCWTCEFGFQVEIMGLWGLKDGVLVAILDKNSQVFEKEDVKSWAPTSTVVYTVAGRCRVLSRDWQDIALREAGFGEYFVKVDVREEFLVSADWRGALREWIGGYVEHGHARWEGLNRAVRVDPESACSPSSFTDLSPLELPYMGYAIRGGWSSVVYVEKYHELSVWYPGESVLRYVIQGTDYDVMIEWYAALTASGLVKATSDGVTWRMVPTEASSIPSSPHAFGTPYDLLHIPAGWSTITRGRSARVLRVAGGDRMVTHEITLGMMSQIIGWREGLEQRGCVKVTWSGDIWTMEPIAVESSPPSLSITLRPAIPSGGAVCIPSNWESVHYERSPLGVAEYLVMAKGPFPCVYRGITLGAAAELREWRDRLIAAGLAKVVGLDRSYEWVIERDRPCAPDPESYSLPLAPGSCSYLDVTGYPRIIPSSWTSIIFMRGIGSDGYDVHVNGRYQAIVDRARFRQIIAWVGAQADRGQARWLDQEGGWKAERITKPGSPPVSLSLDLRYIGPEVPGGYIGPEWRQVKYTRAEIARRTVVVDYQDSRHVIHADLEHVVPLFHWRDALVAAGVAKVKRDEAPMDGEAWTMVRLDPSGQ